MARALTTRQLEVLAFVHAQIAERGYAPTQTEMCAHFGWTSTQAAYDAFGVLVRKGYVTRKAKKSRAVVLTDKALALFGPPRGKPTHRVQWGARCVCCDAVYFGASCPICAVPRVAFELAMAPRVAHG